MFTRPSKLSSTPFKQFLAPIACAAAISVAPFLSAAAETPYPAQIIRIIVPYTAGTGPDTVARVVGEKLSQRMGTPVIIDNRPGASGNIGSDAAAKAKPDGYTLLLSASTMLTAALLYESVPFDPLVDFTPISLLTNGTLMLAASTKSGIDSVADLIAKAKSEPNGITYSSPGVGTPHHMAMELFQDAAGVELLHVPYKGTAGAVADLMGGQVDVSFLGVSVGMPAAEAGRVKALAVGSPKRHSKAPDLPTLEESGVAGARGDMWFAIFAPKGVREPIIERLNTELHAVVMQPEVKELLDNQGLDVATSSPQELQELMEKDTAQWAMVIKNNNISLD